MGGPSGPPFCCRVRFSRLPFSMHDFTQYGFSEQASAAANEILDFTACMRADGSIYGTAGKCRLGTETQKKPNLHLRAYIRLIKKARERGKPADTTGYHSHHAFPKSIFTNKETANKKQVWLTHGEHFQAHHLLYQALKNRYGEKDPRTIKMGYAISRMASQPGNKGVKDKLTLKQYEQAIKVRQDLMRSLNAKPEVKEFHKGVMDKLWKEKKDEMIAAQKLQANTPEGKEQRKKASAAVDRNKNGQAVKKAYEKDPDYRRKVGEAAKGKWYNNGTKNIRVRDGQEIPQGFKLGRLGMAKQNATMGKWYTDGTKNIRVKDGIEPPEGFNPGRSIPKRG